MHYLLEVTDFKNPDLDIIDSRYRGYIESFLNSGIDFQNASIYKEYEFINNDSHGIIDLLLEYHDKVVIIDYKLKNIEVEAYLNQLNGYKTYISNKLNKKVYIYLYSIIDKKLKSMDEELLKIS